MTIQQAAAEIMRQSEAKADYLVNTENLHMETCDGRTPCGFWTSLVRTGWNRWTSCPPPTGR